MLLPEQFCSSMREMLGEEEYQAYLDSFDAPAFHGLRFNKSKIDRETFEAITPFELTPVPWVSNGYYYEDAAAPAKHPHYYAGLYYLQEPSAMTPANRLPVEPGEYVLDLCAAPGGKTTELAGKLQGKGMLLANDISYSRAKALLKNLELAGAGNIFVTAEEPAKLASFYPGFFHKILVDAPCSGEGMFRRQPSMVKEWEEKPSSYYVPIQREILEQAAAMLRPGGKLLYSTCTFSMEENEGNISWLLKHHPELSICEIEPYSEFSKGYLGLSQAVRLFPQKIKGEGHFLALLEKSKSSEATESIQNTEKTKDFKKLPECVQEFLKLIRYPFSEKQYLFESEQIYCLEPGISKFGKLRYLRTGLLIGTIKKDRFEPSQALAMFLRAEAYPYCHPMSSKEDSTVKYLKGETLPMPETPFPKNSWVLMTVDGYPLGWAKSAGTMLKNKYAVGWRWQ